MTDRLQDLTTRVAIVCLLAALSACAPDPATAQEPRDMDGGITDGAARATAYAIGMRTSFTGAGHHER